MEVLNLNNYREIDMKHSAKWTLIGVALLTFFSSLLNAESATFTLDKNHTYVSWDIQHLGFSTQTGKWYADGVLTLDKEHPEQSKVKASINISDLVTGLPELDKHLKSKAFFDVANFPKATFVSNKVTVVGKDKADVQGILTVHGVSKPLTLHVSFNKADMNPINNKMTVGFSGTASMKRSDFGINTLVPSLGDEVNLKIEVEAYKNS
jgi:polyisoprenoid-binding protein YceI